VKEQEAQKKIFNIKRVVCIGGGIVLVAVVMGLLVSGSGRGGSGSSGRSSSGGSGARGPVSEQSQEHRPNISKTFHF
jgi:hypothetical protein